MPTTPLRKVLYIEDDEALGRLLQKRMERANIEVLLAYSGEEGLEKLKKEEFQLVLLDYYLPAMNGLEVLEQIRTNLETSPPVIFLTASGDERIALKALEEGAADYAVKDTGQTYLDLLPAVMQAVYTKERLQRENELQRKELEAAKEKAEAANLAKSEFLAAMSHELRTPMNAVIGLANILATTNPLTSKQKQCINTLQQSAGSLLELINDLLDISKIEARSIELENIPFSLSDVVHDVLDVMMVRAEEKGLEFTLQLKDFAIARGHFMGDPTRIKQVIMNLCSNAIKFTEQGSVTVEISGTGDPVHADIQHVQICVQDTGIGIPVSKQAQLFQKFSQADSSISRKYGGTGLGLAISKSLMQMMGGEIGLESTEGKGSVFSIKLPLKKLDIAGDKNMIASAAPAKDSPTQVSPKSSKSSAPAINKPRILLVEDNPANVLVATLFLDQFGYEYDVASNGEEAVDKSAKQNFSIILMDVQMHGMNGFDATRKIRDREAEGTLPRIPIIGMTAHAFVGDRERCLQAGMDDYLTKPFVPEDFQDKLEKYVLSVSRCA